MYASVKRDVLGKTERSLAETHGIEKYDNTDDLINQIIKKSSGSQPKDNQTLIDEYEAKIKARDEALQAVNTEKEEAIKAERLRYDSSLIKMRKDQESSKLKGLLKDEAIADQSITLAMNNFDANFDIIIENDVEYVVEKATGEKVLNDVKDPIGLFDVLKENTSKYFSLKESADGGRGASTIDATIDSKTDINRDFKGKSWEDVAKEHNITSLDEAASKTYAEWENANKSA